VNIADRISLWLSRHYMLVFNGVITLFLAGAFLTPLLLKMGYSLPASVLYRTYSLTCHQLAFRSWFILGQQPAYPRQAAHVPGLIPYGTATGFDENDIFAARDYKGDERLGFKVALCERDVAMYGGLLVFGIIFSLSGRRLPLASWWVWIGLGIMPVAIDGVTQIVSQFPIPAIHFMLPYRESTPFLRTLTGGLFGLTTGWFAYPLVEDSMAATKAWIERKYSPKQDHPPAVEGRG
jgi:uncharacterized membrane protein